MGSLLHKADVNGYAPLGLLNLFLGAIPAVVGALSAFTTDYGEVYVPAVVISAIVCGIIIFLRNLKLHNIFKAIIFTILALVLGIIIAAFFIFFGGWGDPNKQSGGNSGGQSSGNNWTEQYSQTKGTYYTDGQGNFKDQYGNNVYNPQGITDYDKL